MKRPLAPLSNNRGMALLIAIFSLSIMLFIAMEVSYDTNVEYIVAAQKINRLKAYHAAKAGVELSLLRILLYKKAVANFGDQLGENKALLDPIWNFPFAWPPTKFLPTENITRVTKENIAKVEKNSEMGATYITTIESEGGKIDINDLGSNIEGLRNSTKAQILQIFAQERENNDDFDEKHSGTNFEELLNNIIDWVDENTESLNGGEEKANYQDILRDNPTEFLPPNQPFKTLEELHMVAGMKDDFFNLLKNRVTVYGIKGVNINYASGDILKSLDPQIDDEVAKEVIQRRSDPQQGGPFKDEDEFVAFLDSFIDTNKFNEVGVPLLFDTVYNFRIKSTGEYTKTVREIEVVTFDFDNLTPRMADLLDEEDEKQNGKDTETTTTPPPDQSTGAADKPKAKATKKISPKGRPRIVYWHET